MARVEIKEYREQYGHFGLFRTSAGGDESIIVRRKVGEPTDYLHTNSRKLKRQRANLALASQHYATLTPSQKGITRHQFEEVEYQKSHGKTDIKLLSGRQLFISKEMHSLATTGQPLYLPHELCIMLVDENHLPLDGELTLRYLDLGEWWNIHGEELYTGNWLYSLVPRAMQAYRPYGEAEGYFDPMLPEHQAMTEDEIRAYHYHELHLPVGQETIHPNGDGALIELKTSGEPHWQMVLDEDATYVPPNGGGPWGNWTGNLVYKDWHPWGERADLYTFTNPLWAAQHVNRIAAHCLVGRDAYPYGKCRVILKTHGQTYYGDYSYPTLPSQWLETQFAVNPNTGKEWTTDELADLQLGISMDKVGSYGAIICDKIMVEIYYL